jgi:hypothetical protein
MWQASRISMQIAEKLGFFIIDAFSMTMPLASYHDVFPDGLHLYSDVKFQGNYVSKTISMIFLSSVCNTIQGGKATKEFGSYLRNLSTNINR